VISLCTVRLDQHLVQVQIDKNLVPRDGRLPTTRLQIYSDYSVAKKEEREKRQSSNPLDRVPTGNNSYSGKFIFPQSIKRVVALSSVRFAATLFL
jgi:hypothetical protein